MTTDRPASDPDGAPGGASPTPDRAVPAAPEPLPPDTRRDPAPEGGAPTAPTVPAAPISGPAQSAYSAPADDRPADAVAPPAAVADPARPRNRRVLAIVGAALGGLLVLALTFGSGFWAGSFATQLNRASAGAGPGGGGPDSDGPRAQGGPDGRFGGPGGGPGGPRDGAPDRTGPRGTTPDDATPDDATPDGTAPTPDGTAD